MNAFFFRGHTSLQVLELDVFCQFASLRVCLEIDRTVDASLVFERGVFRILTSEALVCSWA